MKGYAIEMGHLVTRDGVTHTEYPYAILIDFGRPRQDDD